MSKALFFIHVFDIIYFHYWDKNIKQWHFEYQGNKIQNIQKKKGIVNITNHS